MHRRILVLAAHDDGSGAHVTMSRVARALRKAAQQRGEDPVILYLNSSSSGLNWAIDLWGASGPKSPWLRAPSLRRWPSAARLEGKQGLWVRMENLLTFPKNAQDGGLDVPATRGILRGKRYLQRRYQDWSAQLGGVPRKRVSLAIEMGVPQLARWARGKGVPVVSVGDMFWSRSLHGSLEGAGEYDRLVEESLRAIAEWERHTQAVWLLPIVAPQDYASSFAEQNIPLLTLPGFLGSKPTASQVRSAGKQLKLQSRRLVVLSGGTTQVWRGIYESLGALVKRRVGREFALLHPTPGGGPLRLVDHGTDRPIDQARGMLAFLAHAHLGITRGGITITEFISAGVPFVVIQEPDHWLSRKQQAQARNAGLGHSACLSRLRNDDEALALIRQCLYSTENRRRQARMRQFQFGVEGPWAEYLLEDVARCGRASAAPAA